MILYRSDYETHRYLIDTTTKNRSFIRMSVLLKRMGVKNNKFMLVLTQPELQGVDPHADNLTQDQMMRIGLECKINPWYFFREVIRVPAAGGDPIHYKLNRANLALIWLFLNSIDIFLTMPRQIGKTIGTIGLIELMMFILGLNVNIGLFAKGNNLRMENVSRLKELRNALPSYLYKKGPQYNTDNQEGLEYKPFKNKYITFVAQKDKKSAGTQGRGESLAIEHWDEMAHYVNNELSYQSAISATAAAAEQVRNNGIPCANIITTTAGRLNEDCGRYAYGIKDQCMRFDESLYDCETKAALLDILKLASTNKMVYIEYSYKQLGKTQEWFEQRTRGLSEDVIAIDYLNRWIHGGGGSMLPKRTLDNLKANTRDPVSVTFIDSLMLRWYVEPDIIDSKFKDRPFILASDTSDNVGRDWTTLVLMDPADMSVIMTCRCNEANLAYVAQCIIKLITQYPRLVFIPERNKNGAMLIDIILHHFENDPTFDPFRRIFNTYVQNYHIDSPNLHNLDITDGRIRKAFGFNTTSSSTSRKLLYSSVLTTAVNKNYKRIFDAIIIDEICGLVIKNGRIDHGDDGHDDLLVAYLIASYLIMYGRNHHMYGIRPDEILSSIDEDGESIDPIEKERQDGLKARRAELKKALDGNLSDMIRASFERELNMIEPMIRESSDPNSVISMHQVKQEAVKAAPPKLNPNRLVNNLNMFRL